MLKLQLVVCVGLCVLGLVCADCYFTEDFTCAADSVETVDCYDCTCLGNGFSQCCRKSSAMKPSGYPETCEAIFRKKSCSWKVVEKGKRRKLCDFTSVVG
ncbi:beta-microseminoprotein-like [Amphiura filiformis]|uniref:beta-microseminoprotein-like n=1 Tax=Amphiura filiformis TaxID=82378 RepID=UPI003B223B18